MDNKITSADASVSEMNIEETIEKVFERDEKE